jgi:hypothetical protein
MDSRSIGIIFIAIGIAAVTAGLVMADDRDGFRRRAGDALIGRGNARVHFPVVTPLLLSVAFSLVLPFPRRFL